MPDKIQVSEDRGFIEVYSYGVFSKGYISESIAKVRQIYDTKGINKLLVDITKQKKMSGTLVIFELFSTFPRELKLALTVQRSQVTVEDIFFVETIAIKRGVIAKIFFDKEKALQWLMGKAPRPNSLSLYHTLRYCLANEPEWFRGKEEGEDDRGGRVIKKGRNYFGFLE